jgi:CBS domain-containing protein
MKIIEASPTLPTVQDIMQPTMVTMSTTSTIEAAGRWLTQHHIGGAPVMNEDGEFVGVVTLYDLVARKQHPAGSFYYTPENVPNDIMRAYLDDFYNEDEARTGTVADVMSTSLHTIDENASLIDLVKAMNESRIHRMLVCRGQQVVGIVSTTDIMNVVPRLIALATH